MGPRLIRHSGFSIRKRETFNNDYDNNLTDVEDILQQLSPEPLNAMKDGQAPEAPDPV